MKLKLIFIADGAAFNSKMLAKKPLGGAETACIRFAESLARQGLEIICYTTANDTYELDGVQWRNLKDFQTETCDIAIAHRAPKLFAQFPLTTNCHILYAHNPTQYLSKWKHRKYLYRFKPDVIFSGEFHASTWPRLLPKTKHMIIPYAIDDHFQHEQPRDTPPPRAIFTSNPLRSLDWALDVWENYIHPKCPDAEFHLYCGPGVYPNLPKKKAAQMEAVLAQAKSLASKGVVVHNPLPKIALIKAIQSSRVMLYRGDLGESFCLALGEAQALGVPAVTEGLGSCSERILDGKTGYIRTGKQAFADAAITLLHDDRLWQQQHHNALETQTRYTWDDAAKLFLSFQQ